MKDFIALHIQTVHQLELLLYLQAHPGQSYGADQLVQELRLGRGGATRPLALLVESGLLANTGPDAFRYAPSSDDFKALVAELAAVYAERPLAVVDAIYASTPPGVPKARAR